MFLKKVRMSSNWNTHLIPQYQNIWCKTTIMEKINLTVCKFSTKSPDFTILTLGARWCKCVWCLERCCSGSAGCFLRVLWRKETISSLFFMAPSRGGAVVWRCFCVGLLQWCSGRWTCLCHWASKGWLLFLSF